MAFFEKTIFSESLKKISYFCVFFQKRSSFIFRLGCKIIFSGKRNIIFPDNTRKIIFQCNFFGKTIFPGCLEKENIVSGPGKGGSITFSFFNIIKSYWHFNINFIKFFKTIFFNIFQF